jgi:hypothetical protein
MAHFALVDVDLYAGTSSTALDLSCFANSISVTTDVSMVMSTTFCSGGWEEQIAGLRSTSWTASGPTDMATATASQTSAVDEVLAVGLGGDYVLAAVPMGGTVGNVAYFTRGTLSSRTVLDGAVGDLATHSVTFAGNQPMIRGVLDTVSTVTSSGNSTGTLLGAVSASQRVWAACHFLTAGGTTPSITVKIQSDDNSGFTSATDRITFSAQTTKGAQFSSATGAITDTYWRALWTVSGTSPSFQTRVVIGVQ